MSSAVVTQPEASSEPEALTEDTFRSLVSREYGFIFRVLRGLGLSRADAEDCTQQVFFIAADKLSRIDPDRARSFLYGTAVRVASNARRGLRRRREVAEVPSDFPEPLEEGPERRAELAEARALLQEILLELPEKLRRVLVLAEIGGLPIQEIAALESIPDGTAASRLRLARDRFRTLLSSRNNPFSTTP